MQEIGAKIREIRKKKGLSQEELAEMATVNLRTIQRIENNVSEPRGTTLNLVCTALDVNAEDLLDHGKKPDPNYLVFLHLSVITFLFFPLGNVIIPLILWINKKDNIVGLKKIGANLLNFQITWTVLTFISVVAYVWFVITNSPGRQIAFYTFIGLYFLNILLPIIFAVKSRQGKDLHYPAPLKFIR